MKIGDRVFINGYIDEIRKNTVIIRNDGGYFGTIPDEVITRELPSVEPERKTGKWITDTYGHIICSECGWCAPRIMTGCLCDRHLDYVKSEFCWCCGADMRGV